MGGNSCRAWAVAGLAAAAIAGCASTIGPEALLRTHAYDGPHRPPAELATVFARFNTFGNGRAFVCGVDGRAYARQGAISSCPSVVYVLPGTRALEVEYRWLGGVGRARVSEQFERGMVYEVMLHDPDTPRAKVSVHQLEPGSVLTYRALAPPFFAQGDRPDALVPYEPN